MSSKPSLIRLINVPSMVCIHAILFCLLDYFVLDADVQVLNYALTLEHLENAFYSGALAQFDEKAFRDAGLSSEACERFLEVALHEETHVAALYAAITLLGGQATQPCDYSLYVFLLGFEGRFDDFPCNSPYHDVHSFAALSQTFEGVGEISFFFALRCFILIISFFRQVRPHILVQRKTSGRVYF